MGKYLVAWLQPPHGDDDEKSRIDQLDELSVSDRRINLLLRIAPKLEPFKKRPMGIPLFPVYSIHNFSLKLLSLITAKSIWLTVTMSSCNVSHAPLPKSKGVRITAFRWVNFIGFCCGIILPRCTSY